VLLADARADILAFTAFPKELWRQICVQQPDRLNREIHRRTYVVGIVPDRASAIRLIRAVLAGQHDEWAEGRRHLGLDLLGRSRLALIDTDKKDDQEEDLTPASLSAESVATGHYVVTTSSTTTVDLAPRPLFCATVVSAL